VHPQRQPEPGFPIPAVLVTVMAAAGQRRRTAADSVVDADLVAAPPGTPPEDAPVAAVVAVAAISTWLGAAGVRTRHAPQVRRAIDMTSSIAGTRPPALTTRGLA
jgi:hypothetical protein